MNKFNEKSSVLISESLEEGQLGGEGCSETLACEELMEEEESVEEAPGEKDLDPPEMLKCIVSSGRKFSPGIIFHLTTLFLKVRSA